MHAQEYEYKPSKKCTQGGFFILQRLCKHLALGIKLWARLQFEMAGMNGSWMTFSEEYLCP